MTDVRAAVRDPSLPRFQQGPRSQQLLTVLLGDYWFGRSEAIPSAALVDLLGIFDVTPAGARAAIQRLAARGFLVGQREGRQTRYAVHTQSRETLDGHVRALFMSHVPPPWDGTWTVVGFSLPEGATAARRALRDGLRRLHFGNLYDALWIRPGDRSEEVRALADGLAADELPGFDPARLTVFADARLPGGATPSMLDQAFGLAELRAGYQEFCGRWQPMLAEIDGLRARPQEALVTRTSVMAEWRSLVRADPRLPAELLGADDPGLRAYACCSEIYDRLGPAGESAFRRSLSGHDDQLTGLVTHHTFTGSSALIQDG
ncbi:phenylacetic acid degradation operon negative regulatory protein [Nocardioides luteus]|uniref:PaaX family transcriptional regulator n=1 Tax=Nocardioides luteus TaxID=1844 RepID=A0ABQ5T0C5_9ACTN|nr:PaaX family transcriptional regulator C-terminal domain-containing protein [Nocardioides luteus]MDR7310328.1 phenylacetic acid degradation operon negative regulatory protein [Nocardioides luteus]GGR53419.1 PaaX family transcriptional regulator [Nocardioides luteus]GLJ69892.1 PaaX family transcriptional regulator [Nocardioides luteus]